MKWLLCAAALLTGCGQVAYRPVEVKIPYAVPCLERAPDKPSFVTDAELLAMPSYSFVLALGADRISRIQFERELEAALSACVGPMPSSPPSAP